jgi:muramoyltetrapeptide carboxypeptidase LdcA involved in peptidoglycan recycling
MIKFDKKNDFVSIVAPASLFRDKDGQINLKANLAQLKEVIALFEEYGFNCIYDEKIFSGGSLEYFSSTREERLRQFQNALTDPKVKIISAFRGGYGSAEIAFDCLDIKPSMPKILIGFSDITMLHYLFNQHYGLPSIHGIVSTKYRHMMNNIISLLEGNSTEFTVKKMNEVTTPGAMSGVTSGGNLSLICNMIGTKLHPQTKGKILILEDVGEQGYKVHRYLMHMYNSNLFEGVEAVIFADFINSDQFLESSIKHFTATYLKNMPTYMATGIGHGKDNYPFVMGAPVIIKDLKLNIKAY